MKIFHAIMYTFFALSLATGAAFGQMAVVNGASFMPGQPVAPASFATLFGENLCAQTAVALRTETGRYPTELGGCSVMVNGMQAMMHYASPGQVNIVVPENVEPGPADVVVHGGHGSTNGSMMITRSGPGVFALSGFGMGQSAMVHSTMWQTGPFSVNTDGQPTPVSIFMTGLDLSAKPAVMIGGVPAEVTFFGPTPGYPGLQQINIVLPPHVAGVGRVPVMVISDGRSSNVTFTHLLPTDEMMQGMPGWGTGMMVQENMPRAREMSYVAYNPANNTALVTDENDDAVRLISLSSNTTLATIALPEDSAAHAITVNSNGTLAAVVLSAKQSVALIDLAQNKVTAVIGTGHYPSRAAFSASNLLVTNSGSGTVSVVDTNSLSVTHEIKAGFGPGGIDVSGNLAVVANMQDGTVSLIDLTDYTTETLTLPAGSRPHEVAVSAAANKAVITTPMSNSFLLLNLLNKEIVQVNTSVWNAMGPGAVVAGGNLAFIANQMTASVTVADLVTGSVVSTFPVDPGPRSMALSIGGNQLLVLAEGTGTLDVVDLNTYTVSARINAGETDHPGTWTLPFISSIAPDIASAGTAFTLTIDGLNFQGVKDIEFHFSGMQGGGMMGAGMGHGTLGEDANIQVTDVQVNSTGTRITASVWILSAAVPGTRQIRLQTDQGVVMGPMFQSLFTVRN